MVPFYACRNQEFLTFVKVTNSLDSLMTHLINSLPPKLTDVIFCILEQIVLESLRIP